MRKLRFTTLIAVFFTGLMFQSCCTKKDCSFSEVPSLSIKYQGFTNQELSYRRLYAIDKSTLQIVDSFYINTYNTSPSDMIYGRDSILQDMRKYNYVVVFDSLRADTISDIDYALVEQRINCNVCFPFGNDKAEQLSVANFTFVYQGMKYTDTDTLTITK